MSWRERLEKLPLVLGGLGGIEFKEEGSCLEGFSGKAKYIAGHEYAPFLGATYHVSISGPIEARKKLAEELTSELGRVEALNLINPNFWHYFWKSSSQEIPETEVHKTLGRERIHAICQEHSLTPDEERIIDELLAGYQILTGRIPEKVTFATHLLKDLDDAKRKAILKCLLLINFEFAQARHQS